MTEATSKNRGGIRSVKYWQEMHCCGDSLAGEGELTFEVCDGGGGEYVVIHASHFAVDPQNETALQLIERLKAALRVEEA